MRHCLMPLLLCFFLTLMTTAQTKNRGDVEPVPSENRQVKATKKKKKVYYGIASFYADKFNGRRTATGDVYDHKKATAACNVLPLGTWIRVTNVNNKRSVVVRINDRMHPRMKRIVDLSRSSAEKLGYIGRGLTQVKVEVLGMHKPKEGV